MEGGFDNLGLDGRLLRALGRLGLATPTEVQEAAIPPGLEGRDLLVSAPTGTGKTLAYLLPVLQRMLETHGAKGGPRGLILAPTRELADQIWRVIRGISDLTSLRFALITGGASYSEQGKRLHHEPDLIVATPGRLLAQLEAGSCDLLGLQVCVVDEADRMLDLGFLPEVGRILSQGAAGRQLLLLSATLEQEPILELARQWLSDPEVVEVGGPRTLAPGVVQRAFLADDADHKLALLRRLLDGLLSPGEGADAGRAPGKALVFVVTKLRAEQLAGRLKSRGVACESLHGGLDLQTRLKRVRLLNEGRLRALVATDVAARGLDLDRVTSVVNYDLPRSADVYVHRAGRTARAGEAGEVLSLVEAHDARMLQRIERYLARAVPREVLEGLEPRHREPVFKRKKRKGDKLRAKAPERLPKKDRWRDRKNKGKPKGPLGRRGKLALKEAEKPPGDKGSG